MSLVPLIIVLWFLLLIWWILYIDVVKFIILKQLFLSLMFTVRFRFQIRTGDSEVKKDIRYFCIFVKLALEHRLMPQSSKSWRYIAIFILNREERVKSETQSKHSTHSYTYIHFFSTEISPSIPVLSI